MGLVIIRRSVPLLGAGLLLASMCLAKAEDATPAPVITTITGAAAWQTLVGNTVEAKTRTGGYSEFYAPDGVVRHLDRDGTSVGRWTLSGPKVCFDYPEEDDASCVDVEVNGAQGAFIDGDATRDNFTVLPGNAKNL